MKQFQVNEWNLLKTSNVIVVLMDILILDSHWPAWGVRTKKNLGPKLHPEGRLFGTWFFMMLKNSHQGQFDEGFFVCFLSSLKVDHRVAQTFKKLPEVTTISE